MRINQKIRTIVVSAAMIAALTPLRAQSLEPFNPYGIFSPSVEAWQMTRYGNLTPSLYTGAMTFSLPLYTYEDPDFTIPISLEYSFDGYRPGQHSGTVGYGWYLNCGGVITREVHGLPDEGVITQLGYYYWPIRGWLNASKTSHIPLEFPINSMFGAHHKIGDYATEMEVVTHILSYDPLSDTPVLKDSGPNAYLNDLAPDVWHFSFLGHKGEFIILNDGKICVYNSDFPAGEIDVSFSGCEPTPINSVITIKTGDGYEYRFSVDGKEETVNTSNEIQEPAISITSWRLSQITAPNGRKAVFSHSVINTAKVLARYDKCCSGSYFTSGMSSTNLMDDFFIGTPTVRYSLIRGQNGIPSIIELKDPENNTESSIRFNYSPSVENELSSTCFGWDKYSDYISMEPQALLKSIHVINADNETVESIVLGHHCASSGVPKSFLDCVTGSSFGRYNFEYDLEGYTLPLNDSQSTDHWGYWNGSNITNLAAHLNNINLDNDPAHLYVQMKDNVKEANWQYSKCGSLKAITYPTGGTSNVIYEANSVRQRTNTYSANGSVVMEAVNAADSTAIYVVGGIRVREIMDTDSLGKQFKKSYSYEDVTHRCSGLLMRMPRYTKHSDYEHQYNNESSSLYCLALMHSVSFCNTNGEFLPHDSHVAYHSVLEHYPDGSFTRHDFTSANDTTMRDQWAEGDNISKHPVYSVETVASKTGAIQYPFGVLQRDRSAMRGRPLRSVTKDASGMEVHGVEYNYGEKTLIFPAICVNGTLYYKSLSFSVSSPKLINTTEILHGKRKTVSYEYNDKEQLKRVEMLNCIGVMSDTTRTYYRFLHELNDSAWYASSPSLRSAKEAIVNTRIVGGKELILNAEKYEYGIDSNPNPIRVTSYAEDSPRVVPQPGNIRSVISSALSGKSRMGLYSYDSLFRIVAVTQSGLRQLNYSWSGNNIVEIDEGSGKTTEIIWKDAVGPTRITGPDGQSVNYRYEYGRRLSEISDCAGNAIIRYQYNINNK